MAVYINLTCLRLSRKIWILLCGKQYPGWCRMTEKGTFSHTAGTGNLREIERSSKSHTNQWAYTRRDKRHLEGHYRPQTIEIAKRFKFFKKSQVKSESATEFMAASRRLAKTCNFKQYLELAIRDQFVCGLQDSKCQKDFECCSVLQSWPQT